MPKTTGLEIVRFDLDAALERAVIELGWLRGMTHWGLGFKSAEPPTKITNYIRSSKNAIQTAHNHVRRCAAGGAPARLIADPFDADVRLPLANSSVRVHRLESIADIVNPIARTADNTRPLKFDEARDALQWCWTLVAPWDFAVEESTFDGAEFMRRAPALVPALDVACKLIRNADVVLAPTNARDGLRPWRDVGDDERLQLIIAAWLPYTQAGEMPPPDDETAHLLAERFAVAVDRSVIGKYRRNNTTLAKMQTNMARVGIDPKEKFPDRK